MGNTDSKNNASPQLLKSQAAFKKISKSKSFITRGDLECSWESSIDNGLRNILLNYLFSKTNELRFPEYIETVGLLLQGSYSDKGDIIMKILQSTPENAPVTIDMFLQYIFKTVCMIEDQMPKNCIKNWSKEPANERTFNHLITYYLSLINKDASNITALISTIEPFLSLTFGKLFGSDETPSSFFPKWSRLNADRDKTFKQCSILGLEDIILLNSLIPVDWQLQWRLLFSSQIHGESFSRLSGQIVNQGPTIIVVMDKDGFVFGGLAPSNWSFNPNFVGDPSSFLFTLRPKINVYQPSNFNENYQYLNQGQQTLPNGLGMGGKLEYFGLWLDSEYGIGVCNDSCTTFRNFTRLSKEKEFRCAEVEVWGVGQPPASAAELGERSVLDGNNEAKAMLELAGRKTYSDGLRDAPED